MKLTDLSLRALKPRPDRYDVFDDALPNFGVRVGASGTLTYFILYRAGGIKKRQTIGRYPVLPLAKARRQAEAALYTAKYAPRSEQVAIPYTEAVQRYLNSIDGSVRPATKYYYKHFLEDFQFGLVRDIAAHEIDSQLQKLPTAARRLAAHNSLKIFLNWCFQRDYIIANPMAKLRKPKANDPRERFLSDIELRQLWHALQDWPDKRYELIVKLLITTGQRANQIASLQEKWVDFSNKLIHFPRAIMKNNEPHTIAFGPLTEFLLRSANPLHGFYFCPPGITGRPFSAWSKNKIVLDRKLQIDPFTLHDLRRTWSTNAPALGIPPHITERVLSHKAPMGKIAAVYDRYRYLNEIKDAMLRMDSHLTELVSDA